MTTTLRSLTAFALTAALALPLAAADPAEKADKKAEKKPAAVPAAMYKLPESVTLSDEQKAKVDAIGEKYKPKFVALQKENNDLLTAEQKEARKAAQKEAKEAGKKGKEAQTAVEAALNLTDDQKTKLASIKERTAKLKAEMQAEVVAVLTPEQKDQLPKKADAKPKKTKKPA